METENNKNAFKDQEVDSFNLYKEPAGDPAIPDIVMIGEDTTRSEPNKEATQDVLLDKETSNFQPDAKSTSNVAMMKGPRESTSNIESSSNATTGKKSSLYSKS